MSVEEVRSGGLIRRARALKQNGWRMAGISVVPGDDGLRLLYHFDKDLTLKHLRLTPGEDGTPIPSLCSVYATAFMGENEARDQFGFRFEGLDPDYEKTFFLEEGVEATTLCPGAVARIEKKDKEEE